MAVYYSGVHTVPRSLVDNKLCNYPHHVSLCTVFAAAVSTYVLHATCLTTMFFVCPAHGADLSSVYIRMYVYCHKCACVPPDSLRLAICTLALAMCSVTDYKIRIH